MDYRPVGLKPFAEYLEHRLGKAGDTEGAGVAGKIRREVDHMTDLVREITQFGRPGSLRRIPTNLNGRLEFCLALARARMAGRDIRVAFEVDPALPPAALDPHEISKVFLNVIVNALEAMEAGGTLTLRRRRAEQGLKDSGTGLGVATARSVVEQHGGRMDIRSQLGRDTQARVLLPLGAP